MNNSKGPAGDENKLFITESREQRFKEVIANTQFDLAVLLENVHDPHNIGAILRSCDAVGVRDVYVLNTDPLINRENLIAGKKSSSGTRKWVKTHYFENMKDCLSVLRQSYTRILGAYLESENSELYDQDLSQSTVIVFGNEHDGISEDLVSQLDGTFRIPQFGMVQSLNISVSCAVTLYEAMRQRRGVGKYDRPFEPNVQAHGEMLKWFLERHGKRG